MFASEGSFRFLTVLQPQSYLRKRDLRVRTELIEAYALAESDRHISPSISRDEISSYDSR